MSFLRKAPDEVREVVEVGEEVEGRGETGICDEPQPNLGAGELPDLLLLPCGVGDGVVEQSNADVQDDDHHNHLKSRVHS